MVFEIKIGTSQNWDANIAADEIIKSSIKQLSNPPTFLLLFSTIHYEPKDGFRTILNKIYANVPKDTKLIGGTVAGFMNNSGCYTQGITLLAGYSDEVEIQTGIGKNTKRDPKSAAMTCAHQITSKIKREWKNKFLLNFVASGIILQVPFVGNRKILKIPNALNSIVAPALTIVTKYFGRGLGREDEVLEELVKSLNGFSIVGGSTLDDNKWERAYQFFNNSIEKDSVVAMAILTDSDVQIQSTLGLKPTGIKINANKIGLYSSLINKIDNTDATTQLFKKLNWPKEYLNESLHRKTLYYPFGYIKGNQLCSRVLALVVGENLVFTNRINHEMELYTSSGQSLIKSIEPHLEQNSDKFELHIACCATLEALGRNIFKVHSKIKEKKLDNPFLLIFLSGEDAYSPGKELVRLNESFNSVKII